MHAKQKELSIETPSAILPKPKQRAHKNEFFLEIPVIKYQGCYVPFDEQFLVDDANITKDCNVKWHWVDYCKLVESQKVHQIATGSANDIHHGIVKSMGCWIYQNCRPNRNCNLKLIHFKVRYALISTHSLVHSRSFCLCFSRFYAWGTWRCSTGQGFQQCKQVQQRVPVRMPVSNPMLERMDQLVLRPCQ